MHKVSFLQQNWAILRINNRIVNEYSYLFKGSVYDFGCGGRPYELDILSSADEYIGVDWSNTLHSLCADIVADLNKPLPIETESADTVVSFQVLEHLCEPQVMLGEAFRVLKPNGQILLTVPFQWWIHEAPYDFFRYTRHGLEYIFSKAGFREISIKENSGFWLMWVLKLNYQTLKFIRGPRPVRWVIRGMLIPFWFTNQIVASFLDKVWKAPQETASYVVTARK